MLEFVSVLAAAIAVFFIAISLSVFFRQASYMYVPDRTVDSTPDDINVAYEEVTLKTDDGETIAGWYIPAYSAGRGNAVEGTLDRTTALFCHGNAGDIGDRLETILVFHSWKMNVFIFDYRGYGNSTGKASEQGTYRDAMTAWRYLTRAREIPSEQIMVYGRSLGAAIAARLASEVSPAILVLESGFSSAPDMASTMFPLLPARLVCRFKYNTMDIIGRIRCPVLVAHSRHDGMIPFEQGLRIFEAANKPKQFIELSGSHNDGGLDADIKYQRALKQFLLRHLAKKGPWQNAEQEEK